MTSEKMNRVVSEALKRPASERPDFVLRACGEKDVDLLLEVRSRLASAERASLADARQASGTESAETVEEPSSAPNQEPEQIGRYRVLEKIGEGGMGLVYRAEQRSPIRREVVVKVIKLGMDTRQVIARFEAERQALAMMDHPHIAKVHDAGADSVGRPYFVMEYVKGTPITEYADTKRLTIRDRLELFDQVCQAIQHAHHKGIIHRDIKPSNVLVSTQDGKPFAKVIDFGIAKATNQKLTDKTLFTEHALMVGTPAYMSPEQAEGSLDIDTRADVYSLGVLLYELLTGQTPFDAKRLRRAAFDEIARIIREEEPPKPSTLVGTIRSAPVDDTKKATTRTLDTLAKSRGVSGDEYLRNLRGELDWMVMKALEKDRTRRYETPNSLAEDVKRYLEGLPVLAAPPSLSYRTRKLVRKYKGPLAIGGVVAVMLVLGLIGTAVGLVQARDSLAREAQATASASTAREAAVLQSYIANLGAAQVAMKSESWPEARSRLDACPAELRGWEWSLLKNWSAAPEYGFADPVDRCELTPDGRWLMSIRDYEVQLIDLSTRRRRWSYAGKRQQFSRRIDIDTREILNTAVAALHRDGQVALARGADITIYSPGGDELRKLSVKSTLAGTLDIRAMRFSPDASLLAVCIGVECFVVEVATERVAETFRVGFSETPEFSPAGDSIAAIDQRGQACVHDLREKRTLELAKIQSVSHESFAFSPDGERIAVGADSGSLEVFLARKGERVVATTTTLGAVFSVRFSPDGQRVLTTDQPASNDRTRRCRIWDSSNGELLAEMKEAALNPDFSSDGALVLDSGTGRIWNWRQKESRVIDASGKAQAFSSDGKLLASISGARVRIWRTDQPLLAPRHSNETPEAAGESMSFGEFGGRRLTIAEWDPAVADATLVILSQPPVDPGVSVVSPTDGTWTASVVGEAQINIRAKSGELLTTLEGHEGKVRALAATPDGRRLISGSDDGTVRFWDARSWRELVAVRQDAAVTKVALSPDGSRLLVALADRSILIWDIRDAIARDREKGVLLSERVVSKPYVDSIVSGAVRWTSMAQTIADNRTLTPLRRVAALDELNAQLQGIQSLAKEEVARLLKEELGKDRARGAIDAMSVSHPMRKAMLSALESSRLQPLEVLRAAKEVIENNKESASRYAAARDAIQELVRSEPDNKEYTLLQGSALYRCGDFEGSIRTLQGALKVGGKTTLSLPMQADALAVIAMAQWKLSKPDEARTSLKLAVDLSPELNPAPFPQAEAGELIDPTLRELPVVDAAELIHQPLLMGKKVVSRGVVKRVIPGKAGANVLLGSETGGTLVWIPSSVLARFPLGFVEQIQGRPMTVTGLVRRSGSPDPTLLEWPQITLGRAEQMELLPNGAPFPPIAKADSKPKLSLADAIDAADQARLDDMIQQRVTVVGKVVAAAKTKSGDRWNLVLSPHDTGVQIDISPSAFARFNQKYVSGDKLLGQSVAVNGTLVRIGERMELVVEDLGHFEVVPDASATRPTTGPAIAPSTKPAYPSSRPTTRPAEIVVVAEGVLSSTLKSQVGRAARVTGIVNNVGVTPNRYFIDLEPERNGLVIHVPPERAVDFSKRFGGDPASLLKGRRITATGLISDFRGKIQLDIRDVSLIVVGEPATKPAPIAPIATVDATDLAALRAALKPVIKMRGTVALVKPSRNGDRWTIELEPASTGSTLYIPPEAVNAFTKRFGDLPTVLTGKKIIATGELLDFKGRPEIILNEVRQLEVEGFSATRPSPLPATLPAEDRPQ